MNKYAKSVVLSKIGYIVAIYLKTTLFAYTKYFGLFLKTHSMVLKNE